VLSSRTRILGCLGVLALAGCGTLLLATSKGIGISPDSTIYVDAARSLLDGRGLTMFSNTGERVPMTLYPPLFPALLAGLGVAGVDVLDGARWLNVLLFGANIFMVGCVTSRYAGGGLALLASFLMLSSEDMLATHSMAWTEPLFICCGLAGLFLLTKFLERSEPFLLMGAGVAVAFAFLTRYAGGALVAAGLTALCALSSGPWRRRLGDAGIFLAISVAPLALWAVRSVWLAGNPVGREVGFHPVTLGHVECALANSSAWLLTDYVPRPFREILFLVALVASAAALWQAFRRSRPCIASPIWQVLPKLPSVLAIFIACYLLFLLACITCLHWSTPLDYRILSPVFVAALILFVCFVRFLANAAAPSTVATTAVVCFCAALAACYLAQGWRMVSQTHKDGQGYASTFWKDSDTIGKVGALPPAVRIYTNDPYAVHFLTRRPAAMVPSVVDPATGLPNVLYFSELARIRAELEKQRAVLVWFHAVRWRWMDSEDGLRESLRLQALEKGADGSIYGVRK